MAMKGDWGTVDSSPGDSSPSPGASLSPIVIRQNRTSEPEVPTVEDPGACLVAAQLSPSPHDLDIQHDIRSHLHIGASLQPI